MARPRTLHPTPGELEVLHVLWERGPCTVREVMDASKASRPRGYTSVMSLLNVMFDKGLLSRKSEGRAYRYAPRVRQEATLRRLVHDLLERAFAGSAEELIAHTLSQTDLTPRQLEDIRKLIDEHRRQKRS
ncbi:MAG: BlaI/MecI/CopY family transcriptional regulator [Phycisphaerales bacterium]|nr:MAG: BlaI/MecI/CopY family transcriptional regulator [Phycisphaerales bacterium]